jgi:aspartyl/asparaginyl beta-hydroxylase (cupin superfamily)
MVGFIVSIVVVAIVVVGLYKFIEPRLDGEQKRAIKDAMTGIFDSAEAKGLFPRARAFETNYHADYPKLKLLEDGYETVRDECLALLSEGVKERITDVEALGGGYTDGGIHAIKWKSFMFKSGDFIEQNCRMAPKTAAILRQIPGVYTAFFSILEPHQYVTPHFGYYKGFLRYHLGVIIPGNNADKTAWLRVNADKADNDQDDHSLIEKGERYYWKNGEGVVFDDTFLHDAANDSDEVRVVLWLDIKRKMPWYLDLYNRACLWIVHRDESVRIIRENAAIS